MSQPTTPPPAETPLPAEYSWSPEKLRRKIDQAWEMAGCARHDRDSADEKRHTDEAKRLTAILREVSA